MKLIFNAGSYKVALPKVIIEKVLNWKHNDHLNVEFENNKIIITKKESK